MQVTRLLTQHQGHWGGGAEAGGATRAAATLEKLNVIGARGRGGSLMVKQRTSNLQIQCSSPGLLAALSRGLSRNRLQVSTLS